MRGGGIINSMNTTKMVRQAHPKKGFTLLELLIVIGILAILSSVTVLVLNPAELLRQARDTQRINDLGAINNALALYASTAATVTLGTAGTRYSHEGTYESTAAVYSAASSTAAFGAACAGDASTIATSAARTVLGSGWLPVDFGDISGGAPLAVLPVDPSSGIGEVAVIDSWPLVYWFEGSTASSTWELAAKMESARYKAGGANDVSTNDGGTCSHWYEVGTEPGLDFGG